MTTITEIIPKDMPDWFKQDMADELEAKDNLINAAKVQAKELTHRLMCGYDLEPVDVYRLYDALELDRNN